MTRQHSGFKSHCSNPTAPMSLGCVGCPDLSLCGGQTIFGHGFNCLDQCCNNPDGCAVVCPNNSSFADRIREVSGLNLTVPAMLPLPLLLLPGYVPLVFHGSARSEAVSPPAIAAPLYRFFNRSADCRFKNRLDACSHFGFAPRSKIILSGVARDQEVERWWKLELKGRLKAISNLRNIGVDLVTTPNFSVVVDRPRWDDLHSVKRIAQVHHEFTSEGLRSALHINGRTEKDFERWAEFIIYHPEVSHIAFEFTTGTKNSKRMKQHMNWLIWLAGTVKRRLGLVLRGGSQIIGHLSKYFDITFLDSSAFEKAQHRFEATIDNSGTRQWNSSPTPQGESVDRLFNKNIRVSEQWFNNHLLRDPLAS